MKRQTTITELGMLCGIVIGAATGVIAFAVTGQPIMFSLIGVGLALGLTIGAGLDKSKK